MNTTKGDSLRAPGATLHYEVHGSGPYLLLIGGGGGGGAGYNGITEHIAGQYTVVTYDRRGAPGSPIDDPNAEVSIETHADDAHHLLAALTDEPAYVFGSSAGALVGIDLVTRYAQQVRTLIAHKPPAHYLVPDEEQPQEDPMELFRREGAMAALRQFGAKVGVNYEKREPGVEVPHASPEIATAHAEALFKYNIQAVRRYRLDFPTLKACHVRIVIAGGSDGREYIAYRCAVAVAECLGLSVVEFPSHHAGYVSHPAAFAGRLQEVLSDSSAK